VRTQQPPFGQRRDPRHARQQLARVFLAPHARAPPLQRQPAPSGQRQSASSSTSAGSASSRATAPRCRGSPDAPRPEKGRVVLFVQELGHGAAPSRSSNPDA
jgi:hypothetical protein